MHAFNCTCHNQPKFVFNASTQHFIGNNTCMHKCQDEAVASLLEGTVLWIERREGIKWKLVIMNKRKW
jgi:hypothetical protein